MANAGESFYSDILRALRGSLSSSYVSLHTGESLTPEPRIANVADRLALRRIPADELRRLARFCDLNPAMAEQFVTLAIDLFDAGVEYGNNETAGEYLELEEARWSET